MKTAAYRFCRTPSRLHFCLLLLLLLLGLAAPSRAQSFWRTTRDFPGGLKFGLAATGDSTLLTTAETGVWRTSNQGRSWTRVLRARQLGAIHVTRAGWLLVGGPGKVYRSADGGSSWDSVALASPYPVAEFLETAQGNLLAGTGMIDFVDGFVGSGVFFSADQGQTWTARNGGLGAGRFVNHLAADRHGRLYLTVADDVRANQPGLYTSTDQGLSWQHLPVRIDRGVGFANLTLYQATSLVVSPQDSLLLSFNGSGGNFGVALNLSKSIAETGNPAAYWTVQPALHSSWWWDGALLNRVHFARNGDWYSSRRGSPNTGGTLVSDNQGRSWLRIQFGLGLDEFLQRSPQHFVEVSDGKIFMIQERDERVYWTNASVITAVSKGRAQRPAQLYPNPTAGALTVQLAAGQQARRVQLLDPSGRLLRSFSPLPGGQPLRLDLTGEPAGLYLLTVELSSGQVLRQQVVKY
ncbi:T9SS type A sorting domain-containing protein [Hymenobacter sp. B81]|uniref:T9SS type A sorting domain-containing protein n=1 Tax=Hymenobacter sp. B81 TaxID=3344878 RepID=UPI0037DCB7D6